MTATLKEILFERKNYSYEEDYDLWVPKWEMGRLHILLRGL
jgi:hypothetical protein